ncbi:MAG: hypothetical protein WDM77_09735 [Steroidobacteraceae bacterium]
MVALVTWGKGEGPNDDSSVKKLIATLIKMSEKYGVTFIILGHLNKGTHKENIADAVTGSAAWTNSVRLAFMFVKDLESESFEGFIRTVKTNTGTHFGLVYKTVPRYTLMQRSDDRPDDVLCGVELVTDVVWGELNLRRMMESEDEDPIVTKIEKKRDLMERVIERTLAALMVQPQTRKSIGVLVGEQNISNRHWISIDKELAKLGVIMKNLDRGERQYSRGNPK